MESGKETRGLWGIAHLTARSLILGAAGSAIITASSMYIALRMGALPWPTIFVAVLSMTVLKLLGKTTLQEISIAQTAMSAGAMVAGGMAFTLPGLWIVGAWSGPQVLADHWWEVLAIALAGSILGALLTWWLRPKYIEQSTLPYPIGKAAAQTLITGDRGGKRSQLLFGAMGFSAVFTYLRDRLGLIPAALTSRWFTARQMEVGVMISPMALGIGYLIGPLATGVWFLGAVLAYLLIVPVGPAVGLLASAETAVAFKNTLGLGLMVGTGVGIVVAFLLNWARNLLKKGSAAAGGGQPAKLAAPAKGGVSLRALQTGGVLLAYLFSLVAGVPPLAAVLLVGGVFVATAMAATITGETGINPMEIFGIIILLAVRALVPVATTAAFLIAACVAIACGYAGDILNDFRSGYILQANPKAQFVAEFLGGLVGAVVATVAMFALITRFGGVGTEYLPAPQAKAVTQMVHGLGDPLVFGSAVVVGALLYLTKVPAMTLGIGMYLPFAISFTVFLGGLTRLVYQRVKPDATPEGD
ncbi:MAG: peptide transporter, partial [Firmicutes bacterium]|nr:peptide transporter [Bacillota bacterium]